MTPPSMFEVRCWMFDVRFIPHSLADHETEHVATTRSESQANPQFTRALPDHVGQHAVESEGGKQERHTGKPAQQPDGQPALRDIRDAEREREHGHGGEAGVLQQLAKGEPDVIHKIVAADVRSSGQ